MPEMVNHPDHYNANPSGVECIDVVEHMGFNLGNVVKYVWRADLKADAIEDLRKAAWYLQREIEKRTPDVVVDPAGERQAGGPSLDDVSMEDWNRSARRARGVKPDSPEYAFASTDPYPQTR